MLWRRWPGRISFLQCKAKPMTSKWRRYEVLLPRRFNDGSAVPNAWLGEALNALTPCNQPYRRASRPSSTASPAAITAATALAQTGTTNPFTVTSHSKEEAQQLQ